MIFQSGPKSGLIFSTAWKKLRSLDWTWKELEGDSKIQIFRCRQIFQDIILRYRQIFIKCGNLPRTNQATNTELNITTRTNALDTAEILKTFEIQQ